MIKKALLSALIMISSTCLFAQLRNEKAEMIRCYVITAGSSATVLKSLELSIDSVQVSAKVYSDRIITTNLFNRSKSELKIDFFLKNNSLVYAQVSERSPLFDDLDNFSGFYFDSCQIFFESYSHSVPSCMGIPFNKSIYELYGYNENLNSNFLKRYVIELFRKITNPSNLGFNL